MEFSIYDRNIDDGLIDIDDSLYAVLGQHGWHAHRESPEKSVGPFPTAKQALAEVGYNLIELGNLNSNFD